MNASTIIVAAIVAAVFLAIVIREIRNRKKGKGSCSCGGSCDACGMNCGGSCGTSDTNCGGHQSKSGE